MSSKSGKKRRAPKKSKSSFATKRYVKKVLDAAIEDKYLDTNEVPTGVLQGTGFLERITSIGQNTTDTTRIGDKARLKTCHIKYEVTCADAVNMLRVIVFQWHPNSTLAAPAIANVLQYFAIGDNREVLSPPTFDYMKQYTILHDKLYCLSLSSRESACFKGRVSLKRAKRTLAFTAATTEASNHLYVCVVSDSAAAPNPTFTYLSRVTFEDA